MLGTDEASGTGANRDEVVNVMRLSGVGVVARRNLVEQDGVGFVQRPDGQRFAGFDSLSRVAIIGR